MRVCDVRFYNVIDFVKFNLRGVLKYKWYLFKEKTQ